MRGAVGYTHKPVLLGECVELLDIKPDGTYVDATFGRGGHSAAVADRLSKNGTLVCVDRDAEAAGHARTLRAQCKLLVEHEDNRYIRDIIEKNGIESIDGALFDLGVSSPQIDDASRGFSYMKDAPLDMRMDTSGGETAFDIVNTWPEERLRDIIYRYGGERYARGIASAIAASRDRKQVRTTLELAAVIRAAMPPKAFREKQHYAMRTFQALRIAVNDELQALEEALRGAAPLLKPGGRIVVISFHSLEDRIVKTTFAELSVTCTCPPDFPVCVCGTKPLLRPVTKKPLIPSPEEMDANTRSRGAKLRAAERI